MECLIIGDVFGGIKKRVEFLKNNSNEKLFNVYEEIKEIASFEQFEKDFNIKIEGISINRGLTIFINLDYTLISNQSRILGIDILKYIRFKHRNLNRVISVSFKESSDWIIEKATNSIVFAPNNNYIQLPIAQNQLENTIFNKVLLNDEKKIIEQYFPFVYPDFDFKKYGHSFANSYGFYLMEKVHKTYSDLYLSNKVEEKNKLEFAKADFLFKKSKGNDNPEKKVNEKFEVLNKLKNKYIIHIDDEGNNKWYKLFKNIFSKSNYKPIETSGYKDYMNEERKKIISKIFEGNKTPDLILVDLRLLGQSEKNVEIENTSGARLIKSIRERNHFVPIILISATDRLKSLELLENFPYNVDYVWRKPRIDKNKMNLHIIYYDLLNKLYKSLNKYDSEIEKKIISVDYILKNIEKKYSKSFEDKYDLSYFDHFDYIFIDTNFFSKTKKIVIENHKNLYLLLKKFNNKVVIINDVWQELFLNSIKDNDGRVSEINKISNFSLNKLLFYKKLKLFADLRKEESKVKRSKTKAAYEQIQNTNYYNVYLERKINRFFCVNEVNAFDKTKELTENLPKSLIHADDTFRQMICLLVKENKKIAFISEDVNCKQQIALELRNSVRSVSFNDDNLGAKLRKDGDTVINNKNFEIKAGDSIVCSLITNDKLEYKITTNS